MGDTELDGSVLEGGGQVLRNAVALAVLLGRAVVISNIRASRSRPGLHAQHLTGLELVARLCDAELEGGAIGSTRVRFVPHALHPADGARFEADVQTAGSVALLIQIALPCLLFAPPGPDAANGTTTLVLRGGTNADHAPQIDYLQRVFLPVAVRAFGLRAEIRVVRRGYYPRGGGEVVVTVWPVRALPALRMEDRGVVTRVHTWSFVAGEVPARVAERTAAAAMAVLRPHVDAAVLAPPEIVVEPRHAAVGSGSGILIWAATSTGCVLAGSALGAKGRPAEAVGRAAADELLAALRHGACVDEYLQDQLIVFMALAHGQSRLLSGPLSLHTRTAFHFAERLTGARFTTTAVEGKEHEQVLITCEGAGYLNRAPV